ncbi:MAG: response regulator [Magnetococcales bacterium]|nr:response regulator [Magnetococcales bacterium]
MPGKDHILVVDDDPDIRRQLSGYLEKNGFKVSVAGDGRGLRAVLDKGRVDLVVLDLMLPGEDGLILCRNLRARSDVPVVILSARGEQMDRIIGLEMGADDYLPKPFHPRELLARVKSVLRRVRSFPNHLMSEEETASYRFSDWHLEGVSRKLYSPDGKQVPLSGSEFILLRIFLNHPNRVLSREQLVEMSRGRETDPFDRSIDMQVSRLRRRLEDDPKNPLLIKTVRSAGYVFCARVQKGGTLLGVE